MVLPTELNAAQKKKLALFEEWGIEIGPKQEEVILALGPKVTDVKVPVADAQVIPRRVREVDAVLSSLRVPNQLLTIQCPACHNKFQTNYAHERYCSNECRAADLSSVGITWDVNKSDAERYYPTEPPSTVSPLVYIQLVKYAHHILEMPIPLSVRKLLFTIEQREKQMTIDVTTDEVTVTYEPEEVAILESQRSTVDVPQSQNTQSILDRLASILG